MFVRAPRPPAAAAARASCRRFRHFVTTGLEVRNALRAPGVAHAKIIQTDRYVRRHEVFGQAHRGRLHAEWRRGGSARRIVVNHERSGHLGFMLAPQSCHPKLRWARRSSPAPWPPSCAAWRSCSSTPAAEAREPTRWPLAQPAAMGAHRQERDAVAEQVQRADGACAAAERRRWRGGRAAGDALAKMAQLR